MKILQHLAQLTCAGLLTALGFTGCCTKQPRVYGSPVIYGPPVDTTAVDKDAATDTDSVIGNYKKPEKGF
ncbi:MAG: hypothetical protein K6A32_01395 [Bacteroidales bacterium]|nr:hypothetical protein [Bacteroidales bacterium]